MAKKKKITAKQVQATEDLPPPTPDIKITAEIDDDPWDADGLTIRQRSFVEALIGAAGGNATRAARMAGYRDDNYQSLQRTASENLSKPLVQEAISRALAKRRATPEWAKDSLIDLSRSSMANFVSVDDAGEPRLDFAKAASLGALGQIKEYKEEILRVGDSVVSTIKRSIKIHDRTHALGLLAKYHGLIKDHTPSCDPDDQSMFETSGELAAELPAGSMPEMPANTFAKPDLSKAIDPTTKAKPPDRRNRERPH